MTAMTIEEAYRKWADDLVRYSTALVGPADASDLVAEAFANVLARGDSAWGTVVEPRGYLYRAVTNAARMSARSGARRRARELRWPDIEVIGELLVDPEVRRSLDRLSVQQRAVTYLNYWHDLSPREIASLLSISEGTVKRQLARARSSLREVLA
jgi:RNA polymerase sigma factor (sigma-70 family)